MRVPCLLLCVLLLCPGGAAPAAEAPVQRSITLLAGNVYRFQADEHFGVFLVTPVGILLVDPHDRDTALWLRAQFAARFGVPVKVVVYSHFHYDHASGASVFGDTAVTVGQRGMAANLAPPATNSLLGPDEAARDANHDGHWQRDEATPDIAAQFDRFDINHDGALDAREIHLARYTDVQPPDETFNAARTLRLGGSTVQLIHVAARHSSDMTYVYFPRERVLHVVDVISLKRLPVDMDLYEAKSGDFPLIERALQFHPRIVSPGHGVVGGERELLEFRQYCRDLVAGVKAGLAAGKSLAQIQDSLLLEKYRDWERYADWRRRNIAGVYYELAAR